MSETLSSDGSSPGAGDLPPLTREKDMSPEELGTVRRCVGASMMGNALEWFDIGAYGYLATYIAASFFTYDDKGSGLPLILTFASFAITYLIRPIGAMVLGPLGDRVGRRQVLVFTIIMITLPTAAIGILPTFDQVGYLAPILLVLLRILQGFSAGGEYAGAAVFMAEHAPDNRRGFYGSFLEFGTLTGFSVAAVLATVLTLIVGEDGMQAGWWRLPFLLALPLGALGLWMRTHLQESETFTQDSAETTENDSAIKALVTLLREYPGQVAKLFGFVILINVAFYLVLTFMPSYLSKTLGHGATVSNLSLVAIQLVMVAVITRFGALSDRIGRKPLLITASLGFTLLSIPAVLLIRLDSVVAQLVGIAILGLFLVMILSNISATLPALFPTAERYSGFAIGYNISTAIFGGTAALVSQALIDKTGNTLIPAFYMTIAGVIGLISVLTFKETAGRSLRGNVVPGSDDHRRAAAGQTLIGHKPTTTGHEQAAAG